VLLVVLLPMARAQTPAPAPAQPLVPRPIDIPPWFTQSFLDLQDELQSAKQENKRLLLYFGQDGCPYCRRLMEVNFSQRAIVDKTRTNFRTIALDIWGDLEVTWTDGRRTTEKQLAKQLKVQFTPTLLFLDEQGGVALRMNGYYPPHEFDAALDYVAGRMEKKLAFADYLKSRAGPAARDTLNPQAFFLPAPHDLRRAAGGKPLAVLFETAQCAQCDELHAVAFRRQEVLAELAKFEVARFALSEKAPIVSPEGKSLPVSAWAKALGVGYVPAMVLFDARGREVFRTEAYLRPFHLAGALDYVSSGAYTREPSFQRFLQTRADAMRARGERVDLWN
jgi:thioredoxin-related protein